MRARPRSISPMNKYLIRFVALLLVPCLIADPVLALALHFPVSCIAIPARFQEEALSAKAIPFIRQDDNPKRFTSLWFLPLRAFATLTIFNCLIPPNEDY